MAASSRFHRSKIHALGRPIRDFISRYGYAYATLERVEAGTAFPHTIAQVERDFAEYKAEVLAGTAPYRAGVRTAK